MDDLQNEPNIAPKRRSGALTKHDSSRRWVNVAVLIFSARCESRHDWIDGFLATDENEVPSSCCEWIKAKHNNFPNSPASL